MLYIVVDPKFLYLPPDVTQQEANAFLLRLINWGEEYAQYDVEFGITRNCHVALTSIARASFNHEDLAQFVAKYWQHQHVDEVVKAIMPFLRHILHNSYIDDLIDSHFPKDMVKVVDFEQTLINPSEYVDRFNDATLVYSYKHMMAHITFAKNHRIIPLTDFEHLRVLSYYSETEVDWALETEYTFFVNVPFMWSIDSKEEYDEVVQEYITIQYPSEIESIVPPKKKPKQVIDAVLSAIEEFPNRLILSRMARQTAQNADYESPETIYELLTGLVKVWLPAYLRGGDKLAGDDYYNKYKFQYGKNESKTVQSNPNLRRDYEIEYDGKLIFCGKHIKVGTGPRCVRINFEVIDDDGEQHIILGRVGKHGRNARRPT